MKKSFIKKSFIMFSAIFAIFCLTFATISAETVNNVSGLTIKDITILQKYVAGLIVLPEETIKKFDLNNDGILKIDEITAWQRMLSSSLDSSPPVTVNEPTYINVKADLILGVGEKMTLPIESDGVNYSYIYKSSNPTIVSIDNDGNIVANCEGDVLISVSSANGKSAFCNIYVVPEPTSIAINKKSLNIGVGDQFTFETSLNDEAALSMFYWSSSDESILSIDSDNSSSATITPKKEGKATITVKTYNNLSATCEITVYSAPKEITINPASINAIVGDNITISESTNKDSYSLNFSWESDNPLVATVTKGEKNKATVIAHADGVANITVKTYNGKSSTCKVTVTSEGYNYDFSNEVITLINQERNNVGLSSLKTNNKLTSVANIRAKEISSYFSHYRPDGSSCVSAVNEAGINWSTLGENIARGQNSPKAVVTAWMNSEGHRANILSETYTHVGISCYKDSEGYLNWEQIFIS